MNKLRMWAYRFMQGRYGIDETFSVLSVVYLVLVVVNFFLRSIILHVLLTAFFVYIFYRVLSRNIAARTKENVRTQNLLGKLSLGRLRHKDMREQKKQYYFKLCPNCGRKLRLPRVKGKHKTRCPACNCEFSVNILRGSRKN